LIQFKNNEIKIKQKNLNGSALELAKLVNIETEGENNE